MSSSVKINVTRHGKGRHRMSFGANLIWDHFWGPNALCDGTPRWLIIRDTVRERLADSEIALDVKVHTHAVWFTRPLHLQLDEVIAHILETYEEFVDKQTFIVYMPR